MNTKARLHSRNSSKTFESIWIGHFVMQASAFDSLRTGQARTARMEGSRAGRDVLDRPMEFWSNAVKFDRNQTPTACICHSERAI
jgi:hypothetical protein